VNGVLLPNSIFNKLNPNICSDGNGGANVTWQDKRANQYDIYCYHLDANGLGNTIENLNFEKVLVYPSPTRDFIQINSSFQINEIRIYDLVGNIVAKQIGDFGVNTELSLTKIPCGTYFLELKSRNTIRRERFVKF